MSCLLVRFFRLNCRHLDKTVAGIFSGKVVARKKETENLDLKTGMYKGRQVLDPKE